MLYVDPFGMDTVNVNSNVPVKKDDVVLFDDGRNVTASTDEIVVTPDDNNTDDENGELPESEITEEVKENPAKKIMATTLGAAAITSQLDSPVPGPADIVAVGEVIVGGIVATGAWIVYKMSAEHTKNKRKSTWNKHSKTRSGQETGQARNTKRGNKNRKYKKEKNPNKR